MKDLIERLEKATEPDRRLDIDIATSIFDVEWRPYAPRARKVWAFARGTDRTVFYGEEGVPQYTYSLDAALTLVPGHCSFGVFDEPTAWVWPDKKRDLLTGFQATGATIAIALCIAAIKARATSQ